MISKLIKIFYLILFLITPLLFTSFNSELFELPKMYFVYLLTIIIVTLHLINWIRGKISLFQKTFLDIPLILFLISQIICTFNSIDIHISIFGYYSRLNGGLLSVICYSLLYWFLIPYFDDKFKSKIINFSLLSAFLISVFGILEHFGIDKNIWVQDVQSRVFSTLGQPNWLAAYLAILLPFSLQRFLESQKNISIIKYSILNIILFICLLFTKSKSGILAAAISIALFFIIYLFKSHQFKKIIPIILLFVTLSLFINNPIKDILFPQKNISPPTSSNLNITPSENIRKIVWKGSLDLFKKFPIFGTGVETFAYSYYWTRPVEHNLTSEWDFLYNKAHNEYLNFLATTGLVGFITYLILIITVLLRLIKNPVILVSYLTILITNAAGFSVVITSLFFFLLPALLSSPQEKKLKTHKILTFFIPFFVFISLIIIKNIFSSYFADIFYAKAQSNNNQDQYEVAYQQILQSISLSPNEPTFLIEGGSLAAKMAVITKEEKYINEAINFSDQSIQISPANVNFWKQRAQNYYYLATLDTKYFQTTIESMLQATKLAPTDAKLYFSTAQFLDSAGLTNDSIPYYQKAIELKSNYDHAYFAIGQIYFNQKKYDLAKENLLLNLKYAPTNTSAQELLKKIK